MASTVGVVRSDGGFLDGYLPYLLRQTDQTLSAPFYEVLTKHGVARSEWRVLAVLEELGEVCVADLVVAALSPQPTVTHALRRLEKRQLVTRTPGIHDKRQRFVALTKAGSRLTSALIDEALDLERDQLEGVGELSDLAEQLRQLTARINAHVNRRADEARQSMVSDRTG